PHFELSNRLARLRLTPSRGACYRAVHMGASTVLPALEPIARCRIMVEGVVQGVGFRPFVYRLASAHQLGRAVRNGQHGVVIDAQGGRESITRFLAELEASAPSAARIRRITAVWSSPSHLDAGAFRIDTTAAGGEPALFPAPDLAVCARCLEEMRDPGD